MRYPQDALADCFHPHPRGHFWSGDIRGGGCCYHHQNVSPFWWQTRGKGSPTSPEHPWVLLGTMPPAGHAADTPHAEGSPRLSALDAFLSRSSDVRGFVLTFHRPPGASCCSLRGAERGPRTRAGALGAGGRTPLRSRAGFHRVSRLGEARIRPAIRFCRSLCSGPRGKGVVNA